MLYASLFFKLFQFVSHIFTLLFLKLILLFLTVRLFLFFSNKITIAIYRASFNQISLKICHKNIFLLFIPNNLYYLWLKF